METYRPKRPTTLAIFPQVPRAQDTLNNNSFGKKDSWKESNSSSPHITGDRTPTHDGVRQSEESKAQRGGGGGGATKHRGSASSHGRPSRDGTHTHTHTHTRPPAQSPGRDQTQIQRGAGMRDAETTGRARGREDSLEDGHPEPTEEIYLTPVQRDYERRPSFLSQSSDGNRMSISSDAEGPPHPHPSLPNRTNPSISEEEGEVYPPTPPRGGISPRCLSEGERVEPGRTKPDGGGARGGRRTDQGGGCEVSAGLSYDSVKYTLVVDEHAKLELVSLKQCYHGYGKRGGDNDDSDADTVYESANEDDEDADGGEERRRRRLMRDSSTSSRLSKVPSEEEVEEEVEGEEEEEDGAPRTRKFRNVIANGHRRSVGAESFGLFSCVLGGVEREQSHRAVFRFVPRHDDELELEADDPLLMEAQAEDLWCQAYNMRTGASGIFPAYYAAAVNKDHLKGPKGGCVERFGVRFLGSVQVPYHKGNSVLCTAMQKIAINRRMSMQPPSACVVEINLKGVKIIVQDECKTSERGDKCYHLFHLKNISFCGCHPKHNKYFGFITKHPDHQKFACHVVMSDVSSMPLAESVGRVFRQYYKEHMGYSCPTEDIFLE